MHSASSQRKVAINKEMKINYSTPIIKHGNRICKHYEGEATEGLDCVFKALAQSGLTILLSLVVNIFSAQVLVSSTANLLCKVKSKVSIFALASCLQLRRMLFSLLKIVIDFVFSL